MLKRSSSKSGITTKSSDIQASKYEYNSTKLENQSVKLSRWVIINSSPVNTSSLVKKFSKNKKLLILFLSFSVKFLAKTLFRLKLTVMSRNRNKRKKMI